MNISKSRLLVGIILLLLLALGTWHTLQPKTHTPLVQSDKAGVEKK